MTEEQKQYPEGLAINDAWAKVNEARSVVKDCYKAWAEKLGVDGIEISGEEEYDDNNYFTSYFVTEVFGISCRLQSYHIDDGYEQAVEIIKDIIPENSQRFITDSDKLNIISKEKVEEVKNECVESDLVELVAEAHNRGINFDEFCQFLYYIIDLDEQTAPDGWFKG